MYFPDLGTECPLAKGIDIRAVGWLSRDYPYNRGAVPKEFVQQLSKHIEDSWEPIMSVGLHACEFCLSDPYESSSNIWIPSYTVVYIAPSMIKHYIEKHEYKPPQEYIDAVLACPPQDSDEFMNLMKPYLHHWERFL